MPGAGSLIAANWLSNVAPKDGTAIGIIPSATLFENLLGNTSARFDARKFNWLVSLNDYTAVAMAWHDDAVPHRGRHAHARIPGRRQCARLRHDDLAALLNALIGTRNKLVSGYPGTAGITLAMERGEVQGMIGDDWASVKANKADWLREKKVRILMQMTAERHPDLHDVPLVGEFAKRRNQRAACLSCSSSASTTAARSWRRPARRSRRRGLSRGVRARWSHDPEFIRDAERRKLHHQDRLGRGRHRAGRRIYASPKPVIDEASALLQSISQ